jgi:hypothetical protein
LQPDQNSYSDFGETAALAVFLFAPIMLRCMSLLLMQWFGVEFIDENGGGPGVRLRNRHGAKK